MTLKGASKKSVIIFSAAAALVWQLAAFAAGNALFSFPGMSEDRFVLAVADYCICRFIAYLASFALLYAIASAVTHPEGFAAGVIKSALLYLPVLLAVVAVKLPGGYLTNDEYSIYNDAVNLIHDTWFNIMTVYYYIAGLMMIPFRYGPIIVKVIIEFFVVGYCIRRAKGYFGKRAGSFLYVLFLLYPILAYTTSAHRLPVYFLIYLAVFAKLVFDRLENREAGAGIAGVLFAGAVLTQWRTEGIYLLVLIPLLVFMIYPGLRNRRSAALVIISYLAIQLMLYIPQNGMTSDLSGAANDRMKPFYAYTVTNMFRNGLDTGKNAADLEVIDRYLSLETIEAINEHYGDINYEDVLILYKEDFNGVRPEAGYTEYYDFVQASKRLFANNPDVFLRTRWGAFCYAAIPYHITPHEGAKGLVLTAFSVVKSLSYNLFIPTGFAAALALYCLIRRRWCTFFVSGGMIAHAFIVFILAPASYFKYYFPVYILSYFYIILILIWYFGGRKKAGLATT
ncbi:MAG: hypothetical protein K6G58_05995 [Lachnospiraceae bacterium]|nr:hypothetical protein [Lachnospiraceae bacterium]